MRKLVLSFVALLPLLAASSACKEEGPLKVVPERQGGRGESCLITNDCEKGLLCIASRCVDKDFALEATDKVCVAAECLDSKDCCPPPPPALVEQCNLWEQQCAADPLSFSCDSFAAQCGPCTATCKDHTCSVAPPAGDECQMDIDCFGFPFCVQGECVECKSAADCAGTGDDFCVEGSCVACTKDADCGTGYVCESNSCLLGCTKDEQCGALAACTSGRCEARGCKDNRECVASLGRPDAVCAESGECSIPCDNDGGCVSLGGLYSCNDGFCKYSGCESNAECAAALDDLPGGNLILCLSQEEADKVGFVP
jgi:hypothetical protein